MENDVDMWDMAKACGKWLKYLTNGLINWEMAKILGNSLDIWGTA